MDWYLVSGVVLLCAAIAIFAYSVYICGRDFIKKQERIERREAENPAVEASREVN